MRIRRFVRGACIAVALSLTAGTLAAQTADSTARPLRRPGLASWITDRRDFKIGDVVTILVDELTIASADKTNTDQAGRGTNGALGGGTGGSGTNVTFRSRLDNESTVRGQARRRDVLTTELSARVLEVSGELLKLQGSRTLRIDKTTQKLTITGFVRAQDVSARNLVESWRLADAELLYESTGDLGNPKKGIISRILGMLWP
jgi:flagellar L-ring protein precursor FlgH